MLITWSNLASFSTLNSVSISIDRMGVDHLLRKPEINIDELILLCLKLTDKVITKKMDLDTKAIVEHLITCPGHFQINCDKTVGKLVLTTSFFLLTSYHVLYHTKLQGLTDNWIFDLIEKEFGSIREYLIVKLHGQFTRLGKCPIKYSDFDFTHKDILDIRLIKYLINYYVGPECTEDLTTKFPKLIYPKEGYPLESCIEVKNIPW